MAKKLEEDLALRDTICDQICTDLGDVTSERHIRRCLPDEYKQHRKKERKNTLVDYGHMSANDDKKVPEQKAMTVDNSGYEEAFEDVNRPNVESASEVVKNLQKKLEDVVKERENLRNKGSTRALVTCSSNSRNCPGYLGCQQLSFYYMTMYLLPLCTTLYFLIS